MGCGKNDSVKSFEEYEDFDELNKGKKVLTDEKKKDDKKTVIADEAKPVKGVVI